MVLWEASGHRLRACGRILRCATGRGRNLFRSKPIALTTSAANVHGGVLYLQFLQFINRLDLRSLTQHQHMLPAII